MPENTKIWAETRSSLNIWSWIERVCLNDKNSKPATRADNDWSRRRARHPKWVCYNDKADSWSLDWARHRTEQALLHACSRHEKNKLYYAVDLNRKWACFNDIRQEGIDLERLMEWAWNALWCQEGIDLKRLMKWAWNARIER